jgi:integrase
MGIHSPCIAAATQLDRHGSEILPQSPCRNVPLPKIEREEMRFLTPAEIVDLAEAIHARCRALVFVGAYGGLRTGELAGLRPSRVDLLVGTVTVAEILTQAKGKLIAGPPKTRAGRRTVWLPPFVVRELEAHLAAAQRVGCHVFTAAGGGAAAGPGLSGALFGAGDQGSRPAGPAHPRPSPHRRGPVDRRRRDAQGGHRARGAPRSASPWTATATRRSLAGRGGAGAIQ